MWRGRAHAPLLRCALCCDSRVPLIDADTSLRFSLNGEVLKSALLVEVGEERVDLDGAIAACAAVG